MRFDVSKVLDLEYLNGLVLQLNNEINAIKSKFLKFYDFDMIKQMDTESINSLFSKYDVSNINILQLLESDFIDGDWEYADLFGDDISYSSELREQIKDKALKEIEQLNNKLRLINENCQRNIDQLENNLKFINSIVRLLNTSGNLLEEDIDTLNSLLLESDLNEEERYKFSCNIVRHLIEKTKNVSLDNSIVDTSEFEMKLDDAYASSSYKEKTSDETIEEPVYSETILGYYEFYKELFNEVGLGTTLFQVMNTAYELSDDLDSSVNSISKEDFSIKLASLLYTLNDAQRREKIDQDVVADTLMDLAILDRIYDVDSQNKVFKQNLLKEIKEDLDIIDSLKVEGLFFSRIKNKLSLLQIELKNNLINDKRKSEIISEYKDIKKDMKKIPEIDRQMGKLNILKNKIMKMLTVSSLPTGYVTNEYYTNLTNLNNKVLELIDYISENGPINDGNQEIIRIEKALMRPFGEGKSGKKVELKAFILFDFDENGKPYVVDDLDPNSKNNFIDAGILQKKIDSGYDDYSALINDLLVYGTPEVLRYETPYYIDKILDNIYYDKNRNYPTGMVRIRPSRNSLVRFTSQKVILKANTKIHRQVSEIIQEIMPNVNIQSYEDFALYINFSSAIKFADNDSYAETINRYLRKSPLYKLFIEHSDKTKLTDDEYNLLRDIINMSLNAYFELEKKNGNLKFDIIDQIGGKKSRG